MKRNIIQIDEEKCNGCGLCIPGCKEGALQIVNGKAKLISDIYCDGLGECLGECPEGALTVVERDAPSFDGKAVEEHLQKQKAPTPAVAMTEGCPGSRIRNIQLAAQRCTPTTSNDSCLSHWPVQLMLVPPQAGFLSEADILMCADCAPFAYPNFHRDYLAERAVLVGCPKLDQIKFYEEKMVEIFLIAKPKSVTVLRMEVPCCGGLSQMVIRARNRAKSGTKLEIHTLSVEGQLINQETIV